MPILSFFNLSLLWSIAYLILISSEALNRILELTYFVWENSIVLLRFLLLFELSRVWFFFYKKLIRRVSWTSNYVCMLWGSFSIFYATLIRATRRSIFYIFFPAVYNSITVLILPVCYLQIFVFVFSRYIKVESCLCKLSTWTSFQLSAWWNFFFRSDPHVCVELQIRTQIRFMRRFPCIK